jgi:hypothetical protein
MIVAAAHWFAVIGTTLLGCAVIGVVLLLFDVLRGRTVGITAAGITTLLLPVLWIAVPWALRSTRT